MQAPPTTHKIFITLILFHEIKNWNIYQKNFVDVNISETYCFTNNVAFANILDNYILFSTNYNVFANILYSYFFTFVKIQKIFKKCYVCR